MAFSRWSVIVLEEYYLCLVPSSYYCKYLCGVYEYLRIMIIMSNSEDHGNGCYKSLTQEKVYISPRVTHLYNTAEHGGE